MTLRPVEFDRRFEAHVAAARRVNGDVVTKGAGYYGGAMDDVETRERVRRDCQTIGIRGQFVDEMMSSRKGLRLWVETT